MPRTTKRDLNAIKAFGYYHVECRDSDGNLKWEEDAPNALMDEGEFLILDVALRNGTAPTNYFIGLLKTSLSSMPAETTTLAGLPVSTHEPTNANEPGYDARRQVNRDATANGWPTLALASGDYQATSKAVSWTASRKLDGNYSLDVFNYYYYCSRYNREIGFFGSIEH